ncbi:MAG: molybdate transport system ATP-binding protein [Solirubrobacteraceae bacterium]|jgi:molybdate transport system ATP-binding protein|nr:molybdate transport system ATP-binding protein [Solirubrobacteraceae bacterium]
MLRVEARTRLGAFELDARVEAAAGACLAIAGPSGSGKSTLLRIAAGLLRPAHGTVSWGDEVWLDTTRGRNVAPELRGCGYVFQDYALFGHMAVWQNVAYGLRGASRGERRRRADELLERFGIGALAGARPATLSGGERQRVALARALATAPRALLLDEPLSALDARTRASASRELAAVLREADVPALLVTHDFTEAAVLGDRVAVIDGGRIVQQGTAGELAAAPASAFVADFTGAVVLTGVARAGPDGTTIVDLDGGGRATSTDRRTGPVALSVHPWEIALEPAGAHGEGSAQNRLAAEVLTVTAIGNRVRVGLAAPQPLVAEITGAAVGGLRLEPGVRVTASWKATATRLVDL